MSFKLSRVQRTDLSEHARLVRAAQDAVERAVEEYNKRREAAVGFVEDRTNEWREEYEDKSDGWKEGERGDTANEFIESWETVLQEHDELDAPEMGLADALEGLDSEPGF